MNFPLFVRWTLWPFSLLYGVFARLRAWCYRKGIRKTRRLQQPVISIGNLTVGGTGKSPAVLWLAQRLQADGMRVGILSRGYRGHRRGESIDASKGSSKELPGDEVPAGKVEIGPR